MAVLKYYNTATSAWEYIAASTTANFTTWKKTMSGGETSVSGTDDNAVTLSYTVGLEQVFINGVLQVRGSDYTATTGTSITGLTALVANDIVSVICYAPFNIANTIAPTVVDAKGDLIAGTAADTVGRLAVGTNNQVLVADSSTSTGLAWANPGMTLIKTQSFSAVSSVNIDNIFSATYDNYRILFKSTGSGSIAGLFRLRASGVDLSTTVYSDETFAADSTTLSGARNTSQTAARFTYMDTSKSIASVDLFAPYLAETKLYHSTLARGTTIITGVMTGFINQATSYTGLTFITSAGTFTGEASIYGYNK